MKIAITGPESTGKSWLAKNLAEHYRSNWVPEYARSYLEILDNPYKYADILKIAKGQLAHEDLVYLPDKLLFCDTDILVLYIWCIVKYGKCHQWIIDKLQSKRYDLYLLCDIDLPWEFDKLREHPQMRQEIYDLYKLELEKNNFNYKVIKGIGNQRLTHAIEIIDAYIESL